EVRSNQIELAPRRPSIDVKVRAKAERIDRHAHEGLQSPDAGKVYDGDVLAGRGVWPPFGVGKGMPRRFHNVGFLSDGVSEKRSEDLGRRLLSIAVRDLRMEDRPAVSIDGEVATVLIESRLELRQLFIAHQHQEPGLGHPLGICRVEARGGTGE